jgi:hypothetical protein
MLIVALHSRIPDTGRDATLLNRRLAGGEVHDRSTGLAADVNFL